MKTEEESFSEEEKILLSKYVSNVNKPIFVLHNLLEVVKGALFSRYSRSPLGLRTLLLREFLQADEIEMQDEDSRESIREQAQAIKKAQHFYDRILDGYGDDSIAELGGAHLAMEEISMLASKVVEDCRIGGSPLEKSTRYVYFDQKVGGQYRFYREPILMTSAHRDLYLDMCNELFTTYTQLIAPLTGYMQEQFPKEESLSKMAYNSVIRARVLDCLRGLLPASTLTNVGIYGNGRFFEGVIRKLKSHSLTEMQYLGKEVLEELNKVIPSFIKRTEDNHPHQQAHCTHQRKMQETLKCMEEKYGKREELLTFTQEREVEVLLHPSCQYNAADLAAALLFPHSKVSLQNLQKICSTYSSEELQELFSATLSSRTNRRHKLPRALESFSFTFEFLADYGVYRDLQRHRLLSQERQLLSCHYGYFLPRELVGTEWEAPYRRALHRAKEVYDQIAVQFPEEAQYVVPMAYRIRWYFHLSLRELQWLAELRSSRAGHPTYRKIAQEMVRLLSVHHPELAAFFPFVDWEESSWSRLEEEKRK